MPHPVQAKIDHRRPTRHPLRFSQRFRAPPLRSVWVMFTAAAAKVSKQRQRDTERVYSDNIYSRGARTRSRRLSPPKTDSIFFSFCEDRLRNAKTRRHGFVQLQAVEE